MRIMHGIIAALFGVCAAASAHAWQRGRFDGLQPGMDPTSPDAISLQNAERTSREGWREAEIQEEARLRPPERRGGCDAGARPAGPNLCLRLLDAPTLPKGTTRRLRIEWRNLPETVIFFTLERAAPAGERRPYRGAVGNLPLGTGLVSGDGVRDFTWDGELGCGQMGVGNCPGVEIGVYRFVASAIVIEPGRRRGDPTPVPVAWTRSDEIAITGILDMRTLLYEDRYELASYLHRRVGLVLVNYDGPLRVMPRPARREGSHYCANVVLIPPLRGTLRTCIPDRFVGRIGVSAQSEDLLFGGDISYLPGLVPEPRAVEIARAFAMRGYEHAADYIGYPGIQVARQGGGGNERNNPRTWLDTYFSSYAYRGERAGYWLFVIDQMVKAMSGDSPAGPWDRLVVKVEPDGRVCLVGRGTVRDYRPGIWSTRPPGGMTPAQARPNYDPAGWSRPCPPSRRAAR
jgi:hypothetical protein